VLETMQQRVGMLKKNGLDRLKTAHLKKISQDFFDQYGTKKLLGYSFFKAIDYDGITPSPCIFERLMACCGYPGQTHVFFCALVNQIFDPNAKTVALNRVPVPKLYLYWLLADLFPGEHLHTIQTTDQLADQIPALFGDPKHVKKVIDLYPVRLSDHVIRQSLVSDCVARQYVPAENELDDSGHTITFDGHFKKGLLEQMYQNRVVFLLDMQCPVYCRFCFRKHKVNRKQKTPTINDVKTAVDDVSKLSAVTEILITGGEPLINPENLDTAIDGLVKIDHVKTIRIATRSLVYFPHLFLKNNQALISTLILKNQMCLAHGKILELGIHLVHPDELSIDCLTIISELVKCGIRVYVQTPFLKGLNNQGQVLVDLFRQLRQAGAQIYYIFAPCSPIHGTCHFWAPINEAITAYAYLQAHLSDRCIPKLCTATPLGKIEWHTSGWAVEKDKTDPSYTWIRTPYTTSYFQRILSADVGVDLLDAKDFPEFRVNKEKTLDAKFKLDMGQDRLLMGDRPLARSPRKKLSRAVIKKRMSSAARIISRALFFRNSMMPTPIKAVRRFHPACAEIPWTEGKTALAYIRNQTDITDVVLVCPLAEAGMIECAAGVVKDLKTMDHLVCIRLCIPDLLLEKKRLSAKQIKTIAAWADISLGNPIRIEIETWAIVPDATLDIGTMAIGLLEKGVNIYANVPLIPGLNHDPDTMVKLADQLRENKVEFHQLYVSGLDIQRQIKKVNDLESVDRQGLIDLVSRMRTDCSGRQIPRYIVSTQNGEIELNIFNGPDQKRRC
jgi:lysine 2,3-aminomutase